MFLNCSINSVFSFEHAYCDVTGGCVWYSLSILLSVLFGFGDCSPLISSGFVCLCLGA